MRRAPQPIELFLDVFVYAPIGFLVEAPRLVPELVDTGRRSLAAAGGLRRLAVQLGHERVGNRTGGSARPLATPATLIPSDRPPSAAVGEPGPDLPIPGYDQLAASHVVARLEDLDEDGLAAVEEYELAHRRRRTVLSKVAQLRRG